MVYHMHLLDYLKWTAMGSSNLTKYKFRIFLSILMFDMNSFVYTLFL